MSMSKPHRASTLGFNSQPKARTTGGITRPYSSFSLYNNNAVGSLQLDSQDRSHNLVHKPSFSTVLSSSTYTHSYTTHPTTETDLRKRVAKKDVLKQQLKQQQKIHQKKTLPLFPTERTRGSSSVQDALRPVDIAQIDLMPIEFSHKIIMSCIEEIKLRGLKHKYLFRNAFYSPSVEAALKLVMDPKRSHLFSVKMMRMDTVGGLLTTVLSRTYPPLIPPHFQDLFQNPNGKCNARKNKSRVIRRFFFELLGMLPELNRFLFVEILDLCCDLVDHQMDNCISYSKLAIYPGSCCFGLDEYMPTWDTRYLMTKDLKKFSGAFYRVIYAYREERDLSAEELQQKLDSRDRLVQQERLSILEQEHGLEGAQAILRMEARIALGLSAESPVVAQPILGDDMKEISLYADRQERVVADDAISVLNIQLEDGNIASMVPTLDRVTEDATPIDEDPETVLADLRRSVSVASLGYPSFDNNSGVSRFQYSGASLSAASIATSFTLSSSPSSSTIASTNYSRTVRQISVAQLSRERERERSLLRKRSLARFGSIAQNTYPVSPGDIFGISRHAKEQRELQEFLLTARSVKSRKRRRKSMASKRITQWQLHNKIIHRNNVHALIAAQQRLHHRQHHHHHHQISQGQHFFSSRESLPYSNSHLATCPARSIRRDRTRQFRKGIEVYQARGISVEDATKEYQHDLKRQRRREKKARQAAEQARAAAKKQADLEASASAAAAAALALEKSGMVGDQDVTMEEAEVLEAFDYLTDQEFEQFMTLAGLTMKAVNRIRDKAAMAALNQVTKEIQTAADAEIGRLAVSQPPALGRSDDRDSLAGPTLPPPPPPSTLRTTFESEASHDDKSHAAAVSVDTEDLNLNRKGQRPLSLLHMTSMDLLLKHTTVIGDSNLRCYPTQPSTQADNSELSTTVTVVPEASYVGLLSLAATSLMTAGDKNVSAERKSEESNASSTETAVEGILTTVGSTDHHTLMMKTKGPSNCIAGPAAAMVMPQERIFEFETVLDDHESDDDLDYLDVDPKDDHPIEVTVDVEAEQQQEKSENNEDEDEEAAELRELLESMTEEERSEFLRLSRVETLSTNDIGLGVVG
ncbi:hypothetical protein EC968_005143 [Mortierella alpina]|nr:hypothetical protein EC968_005143 [Mortierella alpina]